MVGQRTDPHELLIHHLVMGKIHSRISGWRHPPWRGVFYPDDLTQERALEFASRALPAFEINVSFLVGKLGLLRSPESGLE
jgi:hypothetical protein